MRLPAIAVLAIALALLPQAALAHAQLVQSDPDANALLQASPARVTLIFTEAITAAGSGIRVYSPSGRQVASAVTMRGAVMTATVNSAELGTFVVAWQVFAADTHPSRGVYAYSVGAPGTNPYSALLTSAEIGTATPLGLALQALARWIHFAGFALVFGVAGYRVLMRTGPFDRLIGAGVAMLVLAGPLAVLAQLASLSFDGDTAVAVIGSGFGRLVALRLGAALLAWTVLPTRHSWPLLAIGTAIAALDGLGAHGISGWPGVGQALAALHVGAMGLWGGGLAAFVHRPGARFTPYAAVTFGVAAVTGLALAMVHNPSIVAVLATDYGRALVLKTALVGSVLVMILFRRHRLELGIAFAVIAAAALVAALPPPR